jgi:isopenicillin N synthase-like dioxygenase
MYRDYVVAKRSVLPTSSSFTSNSYNLSELVKVSTVRSFFSRQKASKAKSNDAKTSTFENYTSTADEQLADEQLADEENIEDEAFQEQLTIDLEIQSADIRQSMNQMDMVENNSPVSTSKEALSSLENESNTKRSSGFPRKK